MHIFFKCSWNITKIDHICQIIKTLEQQQQKKPEIIQTIFSESRSVMSNSLWPHGLYSPWNSPGQNTGVGSLSLLQGLFPTQGLNPGLQHCRWILYQLSHQGSPRILEWVAYPLFSGSSWLRNWTGVSYIAGRFFTNWASKDAPVKLRSNFFPLKTLT